MSKKKTEKALNLGITTNTVKVIKEAFAGINDKVIKIAELAEKMQAAVLKDIKKKVISRKLAGQIFDAYLREGINAKAKGKKHQAQYVNVYRTRFCNYLSTEKKASGAGKGISFNVNGKVWDTQLMDIIASSLTVHTPLEVFQSIKLACKKAKLDTEQIDNLING